MASRVTFLKSRWRAARGADGFVIVAVLWILATLAALVLIYSVFVTNTAIGIARSGDRVQTDAVVTAAVELIYLQMTLVEPKLRPTSGSFDGRIGGARVSANYSSEAARIDLNLAPKALLAGLMIGLGVDQEAAAAHADRIVAWRTPVSAANVDTDPENALYQTSGMLYLPRHAPFPHIDELWLVQGLPRTLVGRMMPLVTVFNGRPSVNIRDAAPQVIAALPRMTPEKLQNILNQRTSLQANPESLLALAAPDTDLVTLDGSKAFRIAMNVAFDNKRRVGSEIVMLVLDGGPDPYRVLSRRDNRDGEEQRTGGDR